jgi:hypothetical protein
MYLRTHLVPKLQMARKEVRVEVGQEDVLDRELQLGSVLNVPVNVGGSTTAAMPVSASPMRYEAWARHRK